jgi:hypothetical protein
MLTFFGGPIVDMGVGLGVLAVGCPADEQPESARLKVSNKRGTKLPRMPAQVINFLVACALHRDRSGGDR